MLIVVGRKKRVVFDGDRIVIGRRGVLARLGIGARRTRVPLAELAGVGWKTPGPLADGFVHFATRGRAEPRKTTQAAADDHSVVFGPDREKEFAGLVREVEAARARLAGAELARLHSLMRRTVRRRLRRLDVLLNAELTARTAVADREPRD